MKSNKEEELAASLIELMVAESPDGDPMKGLIPVLETFHEMAVLSQIFDEIKLTPEELRKRTKQG